METNQVNALVKNYLQIGTSLGTKQNKTIFHNPMPARVSYFAVLRGYINIIVNLRTLLENSKELCSGNKSRSDAHTPSQGTFHSSHT